MTFIAESATRVASHTSPEVNRSIADATRGRLMRIGDDQQAIARRLLELNQEWDIERAIETNASTLGLAGTVLGLTVHRGFFVLPFAVSCFLLQHALHGWCPPIPVLRRLGFRTCREIEDERNELLRRVPDQAQAVQE